MESKSEYNLQLACTIQGPSISEVLYLQIQPTMNHVVFTIEQNPHVSLEAAWLNLVVPRVNCTLFLLVLFLRKVSGERCTGEEIGCKKVRKLLQKCGLELLRN